MIRSEQSNKSDFGSTVRAARRRSGKTLAQVSAETGINISRLSRLERNRLVPASREIVALADSMGTRRSQFVLSAQRIQLDFSALDGHMSPALVQAIHRGDGRFTSREYAELIEFLIDVGSLIPGSRPNRARTSRGDKGRARQARGAARRVLEDYLERRPFRRVPPIPVQDIALLEYGLLVVSRTDLYYSKGRFAELNSGEGVIIVDSKVSAPGHRWLVAHELGHYELHIGYRYAVDASFSVSGRTGLEQEANVYASELLIPEQYVRRIVQQSALSDDSIVDVLATQFDVPRTVAKYRLQELTKPRRDVLNERSDQHRVPVL